MSEELTNLTMEQSVRTEEEPVLISSNEMVLMQTANVEILNPRNSDGAKTRIILDSGSQRTYITEKLATQLGLKGEDEHELKIVTFGSDRSKVIKTKSTKLRLKLNNGEYMSITANIVPTISGTIQRHSVSNSLLSHLDHLIHSVELADTIPSVQESSTIELLIGNDYYLDIVLPNRTEVQPGLYLLASKLGWIITGRTREENKEDADINMLILTYGKDVSRNSTLTEVDSSMQTKPDLEDFWNIESIGITDEIDVFDDEIAMQQFRDTVQFENGRYQVKWPWREEASNLPVNRQLAIGRLKSTVTRLRSKPMLMDKYNTVIEDQLKLGIIEKVGKGQQDGPLHYLPHHSVIIPQKTTSKFRIVYDASAKTRTEHKSLNECLYRGPVILHDMCGATIQCHLDSYDNDIAENVKGNIYVDNVITGTKDDKEAVEFYDGVKEMFARASMNIREWASNSEQLKAHIPVKDKADGDSLPV